MRIPQQVSERMKEAPAQALRAVFSGIGQVLLVADRIRSSRTADPARANPAATKPPGQGAPAAPKEETRWRSLDETGNVRLLSEEDAAEPPVAPEPPDEVQPAVPEPPAVPEAPGEIQPAAAVQPPAVPEAPGEIQPAAAAQPPAVPEAPGEIQPATAARPPAIPEPPASEPAPARKPAPASRPATPPRRPAAASQVTPRRPAAAAKTEAGADQAALPVPDYDDLSVPSLRARLRNLDAAQVGALLDYEKAHAGRADVLTMYERRIAKLRSGPA